MMLIEFLLLGLFGLMIGSFLNVCISRLPLGGSIMSPPSTCPKCGRLIGWRDNIPVISYLLLRGRCRRCGAGISARYPVVEVATAVAFLLQGLAEPVLGVPLLGRLVMTALLVALVVTDLETFRLPNPLTFSGLGAGLLLSVFAPPGLVDALLGAALGAGILWAIRWTWLRATGTDAMGLGDVKMLAMIGAFLGWQQVFVVLMLSTVAGAVVGVLVTWTGRGSMQTKLPFGVFLGIAAFAASLVGRQLLEWYLALLVI